MRQRRPQPSRAVMIHGRNAVLEAARADRVVWVLQASGLGHDPRRDQLATLAAWRSCRWRRWTPSRRG